MAITNVSTVNELEVNNVRAAIEHRATWFSLLLDEVERAGADWEKIGRAAIFNCGVFHGHCKFSKTDDLKKFASEFANDLVRKVFEMDVKEMSDDEFVVEFHYCPLVSAWMKLGKDETRINTLCDIAMDGDRGIISAFPEFKFDLQATIAQGDKVCRVVVTKEKK
ncbi:MAG: L-2-amino-thiazoline-4-carboxylic acid hydrolase [Firmicutes bacterium]|nr:L-2-amino-thiazoline-4-carboxylic acid hydrolase [Bacillota bacterium]